MTTVRCEWFDDLWHMRWPTSHIFCQHVNLHEHRIQFISFHFIENAIIEHCSAHHISNNHYRCDFFLLLLILVGVFRQISTINRWTDEISFYIDANEMLRPLFVTILLKPLNGFKYKNICFELLIFLFSHKLTILRNEIQSNVNRWNLKCWFGSFMFLSLAHISKIYRESRAWNRIYSSIKADKRTATRITFSVVIVCKSHWNHRNNSRKVIFFSFKFIWKKKSSGVISMKYVDWLWKKN